MKTLKVLLPAFLFFLAFSATAQSADEIVDKYVTAMGGKEKLSSLKSVKMEGTMNIQNNDIGITITKVQNTGMRVDMEIMGANNYQIINTKGGITFFPIRGMQVPEPLPDEQYKGAVSQLDLQGALFNYKEKGTTVEYLGTEKLGGNDAYKLKATLKNGSVINYFVDAKTNRLAKASSKRMMQGVESEFETVFSDYKQNADGYWFPYTTVATQGTTSFDKIETNIIVDPKIFEQ